MQWKPNVTVAAIIRMDNRYLLVEEQSKSGMTVYNQPAGHLERGESLVDAIRREVLEETTRHFQPEYLTGIYLCPDPSSDITYLRFCFFGTCSGPDTGRSYDTGIISNVWMSPEEMQRSLGRMRSPLVMQSMQDYLCGRVFPLEILHSFVSPGR